MKKMLKIMAMLLVIGAVVFAAGCSEKKPDTNTTASEEVNDQAPVADQNLSVDNASAEVPAADDNITVVNDSANVTDASANVTDDSANVTDDSANVTDDSANVTDDASADENATLAN